MHFRFLSDFLLEIRVFTSKKQGLHRLGSGGGQELSCVYHIDVGGTRRRRVGLHAGVLATDA